MKRVLLSTLVASLPAVAMAADAEKVVEARQGYFSLVALEFGPLAAMAKGEMPYDAAAATAHAAATQTEIVIVHLLLAFTVCRASAPCADFSCLGRRCAAHTSGSRGGLAQCMQAR